MILERRAGEPSPPAVDLGLPREFNLADWLLERALEAGHSERVALVWGNDTYTWARLVDEVDRAGHLLQGLGVQAEQRVAMLMGDSPHFVSVFLGAIKMGAVPVPLNVLLRPHEYRYLLQDSRARVLVVDEVLLPQVEGVLPDSPWLENVLVSGRGTENYPSLQDGLLDSPPELAPAPTTVDDVAFWLYSSGTTGFPKAAVHLHHDAVFCCRTYADRVLGLHEGDSTLSMAPMFGAYGLGNSLFFPLYAGARSVLLQGRPTPELVIAALARHRPTLLFSFPTAYAQLLEAVESGTAVDVSSVRLCLSAGEQLPVGVFHAWKERFGLEILEGMSSTEALHVFLSNRPGEVRPGSPGRPVPGYEVRLETDEGAEVKPGEIGNLLVKGDSTSPFYWNQHRKTARTMLGPWLVTGDKFTMDEEGFYVYAGRADDMVRVAGMWVSPADVEQRMLELPGVEGAAVVGSEDEQGLVKLRAFVVLGAAHEPGPEEAERLKAEVNRDQPLYRHVRWLEFVPELPRTATGKLQRYRLRDGS